MAQKPKHGKQGRRELAWQTRSISTFSNKVWRHGICGGKSIQVYFLTSAVLTSTVPTSTMLTSIVHYSCTYDPSNKEPQTRKELHEHFPVYVTCLRRTKEPQAAHRAGEHHEASPGYHPTWSEDDPQRSLRLGTSPRSFACPHCASFCATRTASAGTVLSARHPQFH